MPIASSPAVDDGVVLVVSMDGDLCALHGGAQPVGEE
jgi:hypothetical protein